MTAPSRRILVASLWRIGRFRQAGDLRNTLAASLLLLGCLAVATGMLAGWTAQRATDDRYDIGLERTPVFADDDPALWWVSIPEAVGELTVGSVALHPASPDPPLPPGVDVLPRRGEAVLSPELLRVLTEAGVPDRFGEVIGTIAREGIATQTERLVYFRFPTGGDDATPPHAERYAWAGISGFGGNADGGVLQLGELAYDRSVGEFWALGLSLLVLPGLLALAAAARFGGAALEQRQLLLERLGATRSRRALIALPAALGPAAVSTAALTLAWFGMSRFGLVIPVKGNVVDPYILRAASAGALAIIAASHVGALAFVVWVASRQRVALSASKLSPPPRPLPKRAVVALIVVVAAQPWVVVLATGPTLRALASLGAAVALVAYLPRTVSSVLRAVAGRQAGRALEAGRTGAFLGWRAVAHGGENFERLGAAIIAMVVLVAHVAAIATLFSGPAYEARRFVAHFGTPVLTAEAPAGLAEAAAFLAPRGLAAVSVDTAMIEQPGETVETTTRVSGTCANLAAFQLPCQSGLHQVSTVPQPHVAVLARVDQEQISVEVLGAGEARSSADGTWTSIAITSLDAGDIDRLILEHDGHRAGVLASVDVPGGGWIVGDVERLHKAHWLSVFGVPGVAVIVLTIALTWVAVLFTALQHSLANHYVAGAPEVHGDIAWIRAGVPVLVSGWAAAVATAWVLIPHRLIGSAEVPVAFLVSSMVVTLAAAVLGAAAAARSSRRTPVDDSTRIRIPAAT